MTLKCRSVLWLVSWVYLLAGITGVLTLSFFRFDILVMRVEDWYLDIAESSCCNDNKNMNNKGAL